MANLVTIATWRWAAKGNAKRQENVLNRHVTLSIACCPAAACPPASSMYQVLEHCLWEIHCMSNSSHAGRRPAPESFPGETAVHVKPTPESSHNKHKVTQHGEEEHLRVKSKSTKASACAQEYRPPGLGHRIMFWSFT